MQYHEIQYALACQLPECFINGLSISTKYGHIRLSRDDSRELIHMLQDKLISKLDEAMFHDSL